MSIALNVHVLESKIYSDQKFSGSYNEEMTSHIAHDRIQKEISEKNPLYTSHRVTATNHIKLMQEKLEVGLIALLVFSACGLFLFGIATNPLLAILIAALVILINYILMRCHEAMKPI